MVVLWFLMLIGLLVGVVMPIVALVTLLMVFIPGGAGWRYRLWLLPLMIPSLLSLAWLAGGTLDPSLIALQVIAGLSLAAPFAAMALRPEARWQALICGLANAIPPWLLLVLMTIVGGLARTPGP